MVLAHTIFDTGMVRLHHCNLRLCEHNRLLFILDVNGREDGRTNFYIRFTFEKKLQFTLTSF